MAVLSFIGAHPILTVVLVVLVFSGVENVVLAIKGEPKRKTGIILEVDERQKNNTEGWGNTIPADEE